MGFNQSKIPDRTVCVAVDLSAAFVTVCHNNLLSKINRSHLPPATARWLSCYLRGRQAKTCFRGVKSTSGKAPSCYQHCSAFTLLRVSGRNNILKALAGTSRCSPQTHTKPRPILVYSSRIHACRCLNAQGYCGSIWTPLYHSTSTASM